MRDLIILALFLWFSYELAVHIIHKLKDISPMDARRKVNQAICNFFSSPKTESLQNEIFLSESEWRILGNDLKHYFNNIILAGYRDIPQLGVIEVYYRTAGIIATYRSSFETLAQAITIDINNYYLLHRGIDVCLSIKVLNDEELTFYIAYNSTGISYLQKRLEALKRNRIARITNFETARLTVTINLPRKLYETSTELNLGYVLQDWKQKQLRTLIKTDLYSKPHLLLTGSSGSGKSQTFILLLAGLMFTPYQIWFADFKTSTDFSYLDGYKYYATGNQTEKLIDLYYELFEQVRNNTIVLNAPQILIIDEYPSFLQYLTLSDKKKAEEIKQKIATLLMMGRSIRNTQFAVWLTAQRADASIFSSGGSRDNFMVWLALGNQSSEAKRMITDETLPDTVYQAGEGIIKIDGESIKEIKIPEVSNLPEVKERMRSLLFTRQ